MIVDCHVHVQRYPEHIIKEVWTGWNPGAKKWPEEKFKAVLDQPIERYIEEMDGVVDKAIIVSARLGASMGIEVSNEYIAEVVKRYPDKFAGCACLNPSEEGAAEELERCVKDLGLVGLGELVPACQYFYPHDERCFPVWEKAQELGIPVIIHAGPTQPLISRLIFSDARYIDEVAVNFPKLKIVICHLGYYKYEDYIHLIQKNDNVFADISLLGYLSGLDRRSIRSFLPVVDFGYYYHFLHPLLFYFSQTFGPTDKLLFGSDYPAASPRRAIEILNGMNKMLREAHLPEIPEQSIHNILYENWKKVFSFWDTEGKAA
ncbi:amidohydrolase family protein [Chloroflexota bacterium]